MYGIVFRQRGPKQATRLRPNNGCDKPSTRVPFPPEYISQCKALKPDLPLDSIGHSRCAVMGNVVDDNHSTRLDREKVLFPKNLIPRVLNRRSLLSDALSEELKNETRLQTLSQSRRTLKGLENHIHITKVDVIPVEVNSYSSTSVATVTIFSLEKHRPSVHRGCTKSYHHFNQVAAFIAWKWWKGWSRTYQLFSYTMVCRINEFRDRTRSFDNAQVPRRILR